MLRWIRYIVKEAIESSDSEDTEDKIAFMGSLSTNQLALHVVRIWSRMFRSNVQWPLLNVIGLSLQEYARMLEARFHANAG